MKNQPSAKDQPAAGEFTGRHMLAIMLAFFGVIITVNLTMAVMANTSWTGLVAKNTYVASRDFNRKAGDARRQAALGWTSDLSIAGGRLRYALADASGERVELSGGTAILRRPVSEREDLTLTMAVSGGALEAQAEIADGAWIVEVFADAGLDAPYRETRRLNLRGGTAR